MKRSLLYTLGLAVLVAVTPPAHANNWTGLGATPNWSDPGNWDLGVPINAIRSPGSWDDPANPDYPLTPDTSDDGPMWNNGDAPVSATPGEDPAYMLIDASDSPAETFWLNIGWHGRSALAEVVDATLVIGSSWQIGRGWNCDGDAGCVAQDPTNYNHLAKMTVTNSTIEGADSREPPSATFVPGYTGWLGVPWAYPRPGIDPALEPPMHNELILDNSTVKVLRLNIGMLTSEGSVALTNNSVLEVHGSGNPTFPAGIRGHITFDLDNQTAGLLGHLDVSDTSVVKVGIGDQAGLTGAEYQTKYLNYFQGLVDSGHITANGGTADPILSLETDGTLYWFQISAPGLPGDYNNNGVLDAADYTVWRDNLGGNVTLDNENPDAATPGVVDQEDYDFWKANFGGDAAGGALSSSAVPEPSSALVVLMSFVVTGLSSGRHGKTGAHGIASRGRYSSPVLGTR